LEGARCDGKRNRAVLRIHIDDGHAAAHVFLSALQIAGEVDVVVTVECEGGGIGGFVPPKKVL